MAKVIKFPFKSTGRFDHKPVRKSRAEKLEEKGQLNIFDTAKKSKIVALDKDSNLFESALTSHDSDSEQASLLYRKAIDRGDHVADSYCNLGILESQKGNQTAAIDCLTKAMEKDPRHYEAHFNLANIYADAGNNKLAKLHYEVALQVDNNDPNLHYNLAIVLASLEEFNESLKALQSYFELTGGQSDPDAEKFMILLENSVSQSKRPS